MRKLLMMKKIGLVTAMAALMSFPITIRAADNDKEDIKGENHGQLSRKDFKFVRDAAQGGMLEVKLGELAKEKGANQTVKQFGDRMIKDHSKANDKLKELATQKGVTLPTQLTRREESELERFQKLSGKEFDKAYAAHMVKDHHKDITEFQDAAKSAQDSDVKNFAQQTLPTLEDHHKLAQEMESSVKQQEP